MSTRASLNVVVTALLCLVICSMFLSNFYAQAVPVNKTGNFVQTYRFNAPGCNIRDLDSAELVHVTDLCYQELFGWSSASCYPTYGLVQNLCRKGCGKCDDTTKVRLNGCVSTSTDSTLTACGPLALNLPDSMMWRLSYPLAKIGTDCNPENLAPINIIKAKGVTTNTCSPVFVYGRLRVQKPVVVVNGRSRGRGGDSKMNTGYSSYDNSNDCSNPNTWDSGGGGCGGNDNWGSGGGGGGGFAD